MVFGVFDGLHEGHVSFLRQARALGDRLVAVVAQDDSVMRLKQRVPQYPFSVRMDTVSKNGLVHAAVPSDSAEGGWEVIIRHRPHVIALGYDQMAMREDLLRSISSFPFPCEIVVLEPYKPDVFHSSLLRSDAD